MRHERYAYRPLLKTVKITSNKPLQQPHARSIVIPMSPAPNLANRLAEQFLARVTKIADTRDAIVYG